MTRVVPILLVLAALAVPAVAGAQGTPPAATTGAARDVTTGSATLTGTVDPRGAETTYRFEYGTSTSYGLTTSARTLPADAAASSVAVPVGGLTPSTTYHVRIVATNAAGTARGADRTLRTADPARPPGVATRRAEELAPTGATLVADVDPRGIATTYRFEYGTTTRYGARTAEAAAGDGRGARRVRGRIEGLRPNTRYEWRVVATNAAGVSRGANRSFVTGRAPQGVTIAASQRPVPVGNGVVLSGRVTGTAIGGVGVQLQRQRFPYAEAFAPIANARATGSGAYRFQVGPLFASSRFRVVTRTRAVATSPQLTVRARAVAGLTATARPGERVRFTGTVTPALPGARASLQRRTSSGRFVPVRRSTVRPFNANRSSYRFTIDRRSRRSVYRIVVTPSDASYARALSRERAVRGRR